VPTNKTASITTDTNDKKSRGVWLVYA